MPEIQNNRQILNIYTVLAVSLLISLIPLNLTSIIAIIAFGWGMVAAYKMRKKAEDEFSVSHAKFLISTIWGASVFVFVTVLLASVYVLSQYDPAPIHNCFDSFMNAGGGEAADYRTLMAPCMDEFLEANWSVFVVGTIAAATPVLIYFFWRLFKGFRLARRGEPVLRPEKWF